MDHRTRFTETIISLRDYLEEDVANGFSPNEILDELIGERPNIPEYRDHGQWMQRNRATCLSILGGALGYY